MAPSDSRVRTFGHEAGAFTGANRRREGRFESAHGGTLFLDELGLMPLAVQEKLLRVVEYGTFERLGSSGSDRCRRPPGGATSVDLRDLVAEGRFKADLLDRLSFQVLCLPPLRLREGDIPVLANHFAQRFAIELGLKSTPSSAHLPWQNFNDMTGLEMFANSRMSLNARFISLSRPRSRWSH